MVLHKFRGIPRGAQASWQSRFVSRAQLGRHASLPRNGLPATAKRPKPRIYKGRWQFWLGPDAPQQPPLTWSRLRQVPEIPSMFFKCASHNFVSDVLHFPATLPIAANQPLSASFASRASSSLPLGAACADQSVTGRPVLFERGSALLERRSNSNSAQARSLNPPRDKHGIGQGREQESSTPFLPRMRVGKGGWSEPAVAASLHAALGSKGTLRNLGRTWGASNKTPLATRCWNQSPGNQAIDVAPRKGLGFTRRIKKECRGSEVPIGDSSPSSQNGYVMVGEPEYAHTYFYGIYVYTHTRH